MDNSSPLANEKSSPILVALDEIYGYLRPVLKAKGNDYASNTDVFKNLRLCEPLVNVSTEKGVIIRLADKMSRISNLLEKEAEVKSESVFDTIIDAVGYLAILHALLKERDAQKVVKNTELFGKEELVGEPIKWGSEFVEVKLNDGTEAQLFSDGSFSLTKIGNTVAKTVLENPTTPHVAISPTPPKRG
jgi:hypothetical protein